MKPAASLGRKCGHEYSRTRTFQLAWKYRVDGREKGCCDVRFRERPKALGIIFENLHRFSQQFGRPDTIVVGLGPGSYAGTRIAIAAAIGLQSAYDCQLCGLPSICAMETEADQYFGVGDARRQSFFFATVKKRQLVGEIALYSGAELRNKVDHSGKEFPVYSAEVLPQLKEATIRAPSAAVLAEIIRDWCLCP